MAKKLQVTAFQDGEDYIVVFHNCRPELKEMLNGILTPVIAPDAYAKPAPMPEEKVPDYKKASYYAEMAQQEAEAEAEEAVPIPEEIPYIEPEAPYAEPEAVPVQEPDPVQEYEPPMPDVTPLPDAAPMPDAEPVQDMPAMQDAAPALGQSFGQFAPVQADEGVLVRLLEDDETSFGILFTGRRTCADTLVKGVVSRAIVSFLKKTFSGADPASADAAYKVMQYAAAVPNRIAEEVGYPSAALLYERGTDAEKQAFVSKAVQLFRGK